MLSQEVSLTRSNWGQHKLRMKAVRSRPVLGRN